MQTHTFYKLLTFPAFKFKTFKKCIYPKRVMQLCSRYSSVVLMLKRHRKHRFHLRFGMGGDSPVMQAHDLLGQAQSNS
jgi:hypothetical protein